ncbi:MAG: hypothetical protein LBF51_00870 [Zoogloeaceae bacterium]|jgi:hypothetical protein|nr:hypothetical protein [Zoogloeaceae bacterium]
MKNLFFPALLCVLLAACATQPTHETAHDSERTARIRLFGQNQKPSIMTVGRDCAAGENGHEINVGGGLGDAFRSFAGSAANEGLGIPETGTTRQLSQRDGILSKAFYREFIIPAGKPVHVRAAFIGLTTIMTSIDGNRKYRTTVREPGYRTRARRAGQGQLPLNREERQTHEIWARAFI